MSRNDPPTDVIFLDALVMKVLRNALRKSIGDDIAEDAFGKWMKSQAKTPKEARDPVADALVVALSNLKSDKSFKLGTKGYNVRRAKGKGASGFVAQKVV